MPASRTLTATLSPGADLQGTAEDVLGQSRAGPSFGPSLHSEHLEKKRVTLSCATAIIFRLIKVLHGFETR